LVSNKEKFLKYRPKKFLGQNFLVDDNIARKIVNCLEIKHDEPLLEIGPGYGSLTKHLVDVSKNYVAIELDRNIVNKLNKQYKNKITIVHKDFLKLDLDKELRKYFDNNRKIKIIGNVPYNITTEILFKLYDAKDRIESIVIMVQREVAKRLIAKPNTKDYGILAIHTQLNSKPKILFNVPPTAFFPKPKVYSSVVKLCFGNQEYSLYDSGLLKKIVKESFGKRRKTMKNSLKELLTDIKADSTLLNFDFSRRPESVSINEFVNLANDIYKLREKTND